jgi:hypothetical protein
MTQEELSRRIQAITLIRTGDLPRSNKQIADEILQLINDHVKEVIGDDTSFNYDELEMDEAERERIENDLRAEQRKRAGL